jgi:peptidoglycan hydrolase-like protein with peptidoglycan-binding domain
MVMEITIKSTVGKLGQNQFDDVLKVQQLLSQQGLRSGPADGSCGPRTIAGITSFQTGFMPNPDGLVVPGGITISNSEKIPHVALRAGLARPAPARADGWPYMGPHA